MKLPNRAVLLSLAAGGLCTQAALAADINVPADFATIQAAINAAAPAGDNIIVAPGTYAESLDFLGKSIALSSSGGSGSTTINGSGGLFSAVTIIGSGVDTSISGFTIIAGPGQIDPFDLLSTSGGGLFVRDSVVDIDECIIRDGTTTGRGGGAHFIDSTVTVTSSQFNNNTADPLNLAGARGGGVAISGINITPNVTFSNTTFSNNSTGHTGGGVSVVSASADFDTCAFTSNNADSDGGAIQVLAADISVNGCTFTGNTSAEGGAVHFNTDGTGSITNSDFDGNSATSAAARGGAVYALGTAFTDPLGEIIISDCTFTNNAAGDLAGRAGAMYLTQGATTGPSVANVSNCDFDSNSATEHGGAVYILNTQNITFDTCTFNANTADVDGGAVYFSSGGGGLFTGCTFTSNTADDDGGAICTLRGVATIENSTFDGNSSSDDGGNIGSFSSTAGPSEMVFTNVSILNGFCIDGGGGLYNLRGILTLDGCTISGNESIRSVGVGVFASTSGPSTVTITNTTISGNTAQQEGAGLRVSGTNTVVNADRVIIDGNDSAFESGGISATGGTLNLTNSLVTNNTGAVFGGSAVSISGTAIVNITNSTLYGNINPDASAAVSLDGTLDVANSIFWNNDGATFTDLVMATVSHSIIEGGFAGTNNLNTDPLLTSPGTGDYTLSASSPAIDAGDNAPIAAFTLDLAGDARRLDDPATADTGTGGAPLVDMGAYEFQPTALPCPGDIADDFGFLGGDGMVSFGDFLALLGLIGPCPGGIPGCTGDIADDFGFLGGDGMVSFGDFLALLGLIGPCP